MDQNLRNQEFLKVGALEANAQRKHARQRLDPTRSISPETFKPLRGTTVARAVA